MSDVARQAGVNRVTVSRALDKPDLVALDTLKKIERAIEKLDYTPNRLASGLRGKRSRIVTVLAPPRLAAVYGAIVTELTRLLGSKGFVVNMFPISRDQNQNLEILREVLGWSPAALVNVGMSFNQAAFDRVKSQNTPLVHLFDRPTLQYGSSVTYDQRAASLLLTSHLISRGNRKIGYVHRGSGSEGLRLRTERFEGFCQAIRNFGGEVFHASEEAGQILPPKPAGRIIGQEIHTPAGFMSGMSLMKRLGGIDHLDALLFGSEMTAVGAASYCLAHNIKMPDQLALAAFDGTEISEVLSPQLTSLDYAYLQVAEVGAQIVLKSIESPDPPPENYEVPFAIRAGETT